MMSPSERVIRATARRERPLIGISLLEAISGGREFLEIVPTRQKD